MDPFGAEKLGTVGLKNVVKGIQHFLYLTPCIA